VKSKPLVFPDPYQVIREEAARFARLAVDDRFRIVEDLVQTGLDLMAISPHREFALKQREAAEEAWQAAHEKLIQAHENH
jgi:hypothetical protein